MRLWINSIDISPHTGYGRAASELTKALERADIDIHEGSPTVLNFCMPKDYIYRDYTVGYTPWESTNIPVNWRQGLMRVDDLWSTSTWSSQILHAHTGRTVSTVHHGLDSVWLTHKHQKENSRPFTFLHVGEPAVRKGGDTVLEAWYKYFRHTNCRLIYKTTGIPMARVKDRGGSIVYSPPMLPEGSIINQVYSDLEMWRLYCEVDCMVYPTRGEGFGFIPLEAIASGLPTILPASGGTGDFSSLGIPLIHSMWTNSNQEEHPGMWLDHDIDEVISEMNNVVRNYDQYAEWAYENGKIAKQVFDWDSVAKKIITMLDGQL